MSLKKISIPFVEFEEALENNSKLLFSGVFGSGKTTFINDFFISTEKYDSIHIYPVNYSVSSNEDIFELIKYDILFQLLGKVSKEDFEKLDIPYQLTMWTYLLNERKIDFFAPFVSFVGNYGVNIFKIYEHLKILKDGFNKFHEKFQKDDFKLTEEYLQNVVSEKGHLYEEDIFTDLIRNLINLLKINNSVKISLVIDDLDRLDPDHIFRLLNIFSAHIDFHGLEEDNKFDFDRVILVCDYINIKSVFHHKYGVNSDFKGYINKFYNNIYWHNPASILKNIIEGYFSEINVGLDKNILERDYRVGDHVRFVVELLLEYNIISFRDLIRYNKVFNIPKLSNLKKTTNRKRQSILKGYQINAELVISFFMSFYDNDNELLTAIRKLENINFDNGYDDDPSDAFNRIAELVFLINHHKFSRRDVFNKVSNISIYYDGYVFECNLLISGYQIGVTCERVRKNDISIELSELNYFTFFKNAVMVYLDYLK